MNMRTYNAYDFGAWSRSLTPSLILPRSVLGAGLGCYLWDGVNNTWSATAVSAADRICALMNHSIQRIDMFELFQAHKDPTKNLPEPFWIPQLERFIAGGSCNRKVCQPGSTSPDCVSRTCPNASVGPVQGAPSWRPGGGPDCCIADGARGAGKLCDVVCAKRECASAQMHWWPFNYSKHKYQCCSNNPEVVGRDSAIPER